MNTSQRGGHRERKGEGIGGSKESGQRKSFFSLELLGESSQPTPPFTKLRHFTQFGPNSGVPRIFVAGTSTKVRIGTKNVKIHFTRKRTPIDSRASTPLAGGRVRSPSLILHQKYDLSHHLAPLFQKYDQVSFLFEGYL